MGICCVKENILFPRMDLVQYLWNLGKRNNNIETEEVDNIFDNLFVNVSGTTQACFQYQVARSLNFDWLIPSWSMPYDIYNVFSMALDDKGNAVFS